MDQCVRKTLKLIFAESKHLSEELKNKSFKPDHKLTLLGQRRGLEQAATIIAMVNGIVLSRELLTDLLLTQESNENNLDLT